MIAFIPVARVGSKALLASFAALLLAGCDGKKTACEDALKLKLRNPQEYRTIAIKEEYGEGKAFNIYNIEFSYRKAEIITGKESCLYDNNENKAYIDVPDPLISQ